MIRIYQIGSTNGLDRILHEGEYTIGRGNDCELQILDETVSREHAKLKIDSSDKAFLTDLDSVNGTKVNSQRISSLIAVGEEDEIYFGDVQIRLVPASSRISDVSSDASVIIDETKRPPSTTKIKIEHAIKDVERNVLYNPKVFWALSEMGRMPVQAGSPDFLYNKALELLKDAIPAQRIALLLAEDGGESVSVVASKMTDKYASNEFVVSRTVIGELLSQKVAILISDVKTSEKFSGQQSIISSGISSAMAMPLFDNEDVQGILYIDTTSIQEHYSEDHLRIFATFGDVLSAKLGNQRLLKDKQQKAVLEAELKISKEMQTELEAANLELRETQAQLVQSKKMASLGHLVAGISHEMNTPLGSIVSNFDFSNRIVELINEVLSNKQNNELFENQPKLIKAMNLFVRTNNVARTAADKIDSIVSALRNFARLDEAEIKECDLHEGIETALVLLGHELHDGIKIIRNYGKLPLVECSGREINQVLMSIILNAIQAIEEEGTITITTELKDNHTRILISDTGKGIGREHISKVFDPGFTTKGVGVGIGLGLSIAYNIMLSHNGSIKVESKKGEGTTFIISCPVKYNGKKIKY